MRVLLTYFRPSGKFYSEGEYEAWDGKPLYEIWADVKSLMIAKCLPGLMAGHDDYIVSIDVPAHPTRHPHLIIPDMSDNSD